MIRGAFLASALVVASGAFAADLGAKKPSPAAPAVSAACKETRSLPADVFGFSTGSDVSDLHAWGAAVDTVTSFGSRGGTFTSFAPLFQVSGSFFPCFEVGPYVGGVFSNFKAYGTNFSASTTGIGGGIELKYKLLGRSVHGLGLTLAITPSVTHFDFPGNVNGTAYGASFRLLSDFEIMRDRLFGAVNLEYVPGWLRSGGVTTETSFLNIRAALSTKVLDNLYVGVEASHQRAYAGTGFNRDAGHANFVGPTFFWQATEKLSINGAWAYQVSGDSLLPGRKLNLETFNRHQLRVKAAYAF
jgi:hypothetical protein